MGFGGLGGDWGGGADDLPMSNPKLEDAKREFC